MRRNASWKVFVIGAAMAGLSLIGAGAASAQATSTDCQNTGPSTTRCETNGSCSIYTAPKPQSERSVHPYGPFFWQNPNVGSAAR